jgi:2,4-didehydro-3-deoxy-L-rhamnonate hydrolase
MTVLQLPAPRNVYCIGRNHSSLLATATESISSAADAVLPLLASKATSALTGPDAAIPIQRQNRQVDWEAELVLQIAEPAFALADTASARAVIGCWGVGNDVSDRWWQGVGGGQWVRGKSFPGFAPHNIDAISPAPDFNLERRVRCWVNDVLMQDSQLTEYIHPPDWLVWHLSQSMALLPGDLIFCGTFPGCGFRQTPERYLRAGDHLRTWIEDLGELNNPVIQV